MGCLNLEKGNEEGKRVVVIEDVPTTVRPPTSIPYLEFSDRFDDKMEQLETITKRVDNKFSEWFGVYNKEVMPGTLRFVQFLNRTRRDKGFNSVDAFIALANQEIGVLEERGELRNSPGLSSQLTKFTEEVATLLREKDAVVQELRIIFPQLLLFA